MNIFKDKTKMDINIEKNKVNKNRLIEYLKKEVVLVIALSLAIITSFFSMPKLEYIDFKVLILLFNLMIVVAAFKELNLLDFAAAYVIKKCKSYRSLLFAMTFITFIFAMIVTNDVALITFVPITLIIGRKLKIDCMKIIILQTISANLGSSLTPMGNPQNLFIYSYYNINPIEFFCVTLPISILLIVFLLIDIFRSKNNSLEVKLNEVRIGAKFSIVSFSVLLIIILMSVFHLINYKIAFVITIITVGISRKDLFKRVDYSLLLTFIGFFIFIGNISNMDYIKNIMQSVLKDGNSTYFISILSSQVISNVPATMLLSGFTNHYKELLLGVNIGGLGTLIASLASIISYKLYTRDNSEKTKEYVKLFTIYNVVYLILITFIIKVLVIN